MSQSVLYGIDELLKRSETLEINEPYEYDGCEEYESYAEEVHRRHRPSLFEYPYKPSSKIQFSIPLEGIDTSKYSTVPKPSENKEEFQIPELTQSKRRFRKSFVLPELATPTKKTLQYPDVGEYKRVLNFYRPDLPHHPPPSSFWKTLFALLGPIFSLLLWILRVLFKGLYKLFEYLYHLSEPSN